MASFNVHAGVDGWGRGFDLVESCRVLDADVLVLQENWSDSSVSVAQLVAAELGYEVRELWFARGRRYPSAGPARSGWGPPVVAPPGAHGIRLVRGDPSVPGQVAQTTAVLPGEAQPRPGRWGIAVLSKIGVVSSSVVDLGKLPRDLARRGAITLEVDLGSSHLEVIGTHLSHLTQGSPVQYRRLRRQLGARPAVGPKVLAADMNLWGPAVVALLPGWRRAVRGRTWPAWRPHSQLDHLLISPGLEVLSASVVRIGGSDHWPVRALLRVSPNELTASPRP